MQYVISEDMRRLYREDLLVQATNFSDRVATTINDVVLDAACEHGNGMVDGYLLPLNLAEATYTDRFKQVMRIHASRFAMDYLIQGDETIRAQAEESISYLESLKESMGDGDSGLQSKAPVVSFDPGRRWNVRF